MQKQQGKGAVIYVRVSTGEQAQGPCNLDNQESRCREYCERQGWAVLNTFIDPGKSARSVDRPQFQQMLAYCRTNRRHVQFVVVSDLSRFARNNEDQARTIHELKRIGVGLRSTYESNIDETAAGQLAAGIVGTFNQYFSDSLSEKMQERTRQSVRAGRFPWKAPIGYQNVGGKVGANIEPHSDQAPHIHRAFELMATGQYKKTEVLKIVTDEGLSTSKGKPLTAQTFQAVLRNRLYAGWVSLNKDEEFEPVRGLHEPLIGQDIFDRVQAVLDGRKAASVPRRKLNPSFPLKLFVKCGVCGVPLTGGLSKGRTKSYRYYWCRNPDCRAVKLRGEELEEGFRAVLRRLNARADVVSRFPKIAAKAWGDRQGDAEKQRKKLEQRLEDQRGRQRRLLDSMLDGIITGVTYREREKDFASEIAVTEQEIAALDSQRGIRDEFIRFAEIQLMDISKAWELAQPEQRVRVQNLLFEGGLAYSPGQWILNRPKPSLYNVLEGMNDEEVLLASPTRFELVLSP